MHATIILALSIASLALLPQRVLSSKQPAHPEVQSSYLYSFPNRLLQKRPLSLGCCYTYVAISKQTSTTSSPNSVGSSPDSIIDASSPPPSYVIILAAYPSPVPSNGYSTQVNFVSNNIVKEIPAGCSPISTSAVKCTTPSGTSTLSAEFANVYVQDGGSPRPQSVAINGAACMLAPLCSPSGPSPPPPVISGQPQPAPPGPPAASSASGGPAVTSSAGGGGGGKAASPTSAGSGPPAVSNPASTGAHGGSATGNLGTTPTNSSGAGSSGHDLDETKARVSQAGLIVGSSMGIALIVLLVGLFVVRRRQRRTAAFAATLTITKSAGSSTLAPSPSLESQGFSRFAINAAGWWESISDMKRKTTPKLPVLNSGNWHTRNSPSPLTSAGARGVAIDVPNRHLSLQSSGGVSSVFGILDSYTMTYNEKEDGLLSRSNSISRNPALAAAVTAVEDLSAAAAAGGIRHEKTIMGGAILSAAAVFRQEKMMTSNSGSGVADMAGGDIQHERIPPVRDGAAAVTLFNIPEEAPVHYFDEEVNYFEDENDQLETVHMDTADYHPNGLREIDHRRPSITIHPSTVAEMPTNPSTSSKVSSSPSPTNARARLYRAVSAASERIRQQVNRRSWYASPKLEPKTAEIVVPVPPIKRAGPRYPNEGVAFTRPVKSSQRRGGGGGGGGLKSEANDRRGSRDSFVTSIRPEHYEQQLQQQQVMGADDDDSLTLSGDTVNFTKPSFHSAPLPSTLIQTYTLTYSPPTESNPNYDNNYNHNNHNTTNHSSRRGYSRPIQIRSQELDPISRPIDIIHVQAPARGNNDGPRSGALYGYM